jgi:hypothetical protein
MQAVSLSTISFPSLNSFNVGFAAGNYPTGHTPARMLWKIELKAYVPLAPKAIHSRNL